MSTTPLGGQQPADQRPDLTVVPTAGPASTDTPDGAPAPVETKQSRRAAKRAEAAQAGQARRHQRLLLLALRPGRLRARSAAKGLVLEQQLHGEQRGPETATLGETLVRSRGKAGGDRALDRTQAKLDRVVGRRDSLQATRQKLLTKADHRQGDIVAHPDGGVRTAGETLVDQASQRAEIAGEEEQGSRRHTRLPRVLRLAPKIVLVVDFVLLSYFFSGVTNVDWTQPLGAGLLFALMLAGAVTWVSFGFFTLAGKLLNRHKGDDGHVALGELDPVTKVVGAVAGAGLVVLCLLMFVRMRTEVLQALGPRSGGSALVIAITLAVVSILANTMVVVVHACDGSEDTARLDSLGHAVRKLLRKEHKLREQAAVIIPQLAVLTREAERAAATGITRAGRQVTAADQVVDAARSIHQGVGLLSDAAADPNEGRGVAGYRSPAADPKVDERPVRLAADHARQPLPAPELPETGTGPGKAA